MEYISYQFILIHILRRQITNADWEAVLLVPAGFSRLCLGSSCGLKQKEVALVSISGPPSPPSPLKLTLNG